MFMYICTVPLSPQPSSERKSLTYDSILRDLINEEQQYIRHLNLILKVFKESFLASRRLFPLAVRV